MSLTDIPPGSIILFDPKEVTKKPEEAPHDQEQIVFWPKGAAVPIAGVYVDGSWYQTSVSKKTVNYRKFDGEIDFWMQIPQIRIKK